MKKAEKRKKTAAKKRPVLKLKIDSVEDLARAELSGAEDRSPSTEASETDDDENEGVGDGSIGRTTKSEF